MEASDTSNSPQHSEDTPRAHTRLCLLLLVGDMVVALLSVVCIFENTTGTLLEKKTASHAETQGVYLKGAQGGYNVNVLQRVTHYTDRVQTLTTATARPDQCPPLWGFCSMFVYKEIGLKAEADVITIRFQKL